MRCGVIDLDKNIIIAKVISQLQQELTLALVAADNAHKAATDDQSVAETQYDTLAIEQSYLAEGQSRRVDEIRYAIKMLTSFQLDLSFDRTLNQENVKMGSLVQLEQDIAKQHWFFIAPVAGGYRYQLALNASINNVTVITPQSPMGATLLDKELDDEISLAIGSNKITDFITAIK
jgi:transcription elongation GreA/GreB family factor